MKRLSLFVVGLVFAVCVSATERTVRFSVSGWTCGSCATASRMALRKLDGVAEVTTNASKQEAIVRYDDTQVTPEKMVATFARLGYRAVVLPQRAVAPPAGSATTSFFEVPLGCPAVKNLGCGSLAAPILEELERDPQIAEAWIDHEGAILAVVWKGSPGSGSRVAAAFKKSGLDVEPLKGDARDRASRSFAARKGWHRGEDVANLSREEARVLAARLVRPVEQELGASKSSALREEFRAAFERCFIGREPMDRDDFAKIALKYVDQSGVEKMERAFDECLDEGNAAEK